MMITVLMLPPSVTALGFVAATAATAIDLPFSILEGRSPQTYSVFLDLQANVVELEERRYLVEHQVPGREGGILQDVGSACARVTIAGKWIYENKPRRDLLDLIPVLKSMNISWNWLRVQTMRLIHRMRTPVLIASDIITSSVMIESLKFRHVGGVPNVYDYTMILREWNPALTVLGLTGVMTSLIPSIMQTGTHVGH